MYNKYNSLTSQHKITLDGLMCVKINQLIKDDIDPFF